MNETATINHRDVKIQYVPPAPVIDPRLRLLLLAVRRALLTLADGIAEYIGLDRTTR